MRLSASHRVARLTRKRRCVGYPDPMSNRPKPVASLYARLSVAADDSNLSLGGMVDDMRDLCERSGFDVGYVHVDDGLTGGRRDRDEFKAWLDDAREGRAQVLVNPYTDRLTREGLQVAAAILDVVEGKDPQSGRIVHPPVRMVDLQGLDSEHGDAFRLRFVLQAEVARAERERIKARQRNSQRRLIKAGRYRGGPAPFGYRGVEVEGGTGYTLEIVEEEAEFIREAVRRVLDGHSLNRVCRWANDQGLKPRKAQQWGRSSLAVVLTGQAILGRVSSKGKLVRTDAGDILAPYPPVLGLATHTAVCAVLKKSATGKRAPVKRLHLLSGILHCWSCMKPLTMAARKGGLSAYRCSSRTRGFKCAGLVSCSKEAVERAVTDLYLSRYGDEPMYTTFTIVEGLEDLAEIQEEIKDCLAEISEEATPDLMSRLQRLQKRRREAEAKPPTKRVVRRATGQTVSEWWETAHLDDRRDAIRNEWGRMVLHKGRPGKQGFDLSRLEFPDLEDSERG